MYPDVHLGADMCSKTTETHSFYVQGNMYLNTVDSLIWGPWYHTFSYVGPEKSAREDGGPDTVLFSF